MAKLVIRKLRASGGRLEKVLSTSVQYQRGHSARTTPRRSTPEVKDLRVKPELLETRVATLQRELALLAPKLDLSPS